MASGLALIGISIQEPVAIYAVRLVFEFLQVRYKWGRHMRPEKRTWCSRRQEVRDKMIRRLSALRSVASRPLGSVPSGPIPSEDNAFYKNEVLERFGAISTKLVTLRQLTVFGRRLTLEKLLKSGNYLRTELPVR